MNSKEDWLVVFWRASPSSPCQSRLGKATVLIKGAVKGPEKVSCLVLCLFLFHDSYVPEWLVRKVLSASPKASPVRSREVKRDEFESGPGVS
ncbi:hypothetical protein CH063_10098 [Colletotrichum higginsianum]|uniref:Uncharacterized protein n=1 Tax=Colletotrichum higginsianum (strain IMI 349063) TaxID=759273 RepID=H1VG65_COLHI|nr:hypothetical protein CH063_10098 [Colletotrichum higginsianum]